MATYRLGIGQALGIVGLAATLLLAVAAAAQQTERFGERVRDLFFAGFEGNPDALQKGMAIAAGTLEGEPDHPQALAWQAVGWHFQSGLAFQQGDTGNGLTLFDKAVAQFERAVSLAPEDVGVLIPRAVGYAAFCKVRNAPSDAQHVAGNCDRRLCEGPRVAAALFRESFDPRPWRASRWNRGCFVATGETQRSTTVSAAHGRRATRFAIRDDGATAARGIGEAGPTDLPRLPQIASRGHCQRKPSRPTWGAPMTKFVPASPTVILAQSSINA